MDNLNALKVADLKQMLRARGLSIVGVKSDLIQRLESALLNESVGNPVSLVVGNAKLIEKDIDEEAILGGDDDTKPDETLIHNEDLLLGETSIVSNAGATQLATAATDRVAIGKTTSAVAMNKPVNPAVTNQEKSNTTLANVAKTTTKTILTPEQRKQMRLLKFSDPKLQNRAQRFGVIESKPNTSTEVDKLKQRVQRFGEVVSSKAKTLEEQDRIEKRRERFGVVSTANKINGSTKASTTVNAPTETIQKRQARFGVVDKPTTGGFKRRRFAY